MNRGVLSFKAGQATTSLSAAAAALAQSAGRHRTALAALFLGRPRCALLGVPSPGGMG